MQNNLFDFATDELSQDAFLCWCANWVNYDLPLNGLGKDLVSLVSGLAPCDVHSVSIYRQFMKIDVLLIVNDTLAVIVEDKVYSSEHDDQISNYISVLSALKDSDGITEIYGNEYRISDIRAVFIKTGNFYPNDEVTAKQVKSFSRAELKKLLQPYIGLSEIVGGFYERLICLDNWYGQYEKMIDSGDFENALKENYGQLYLARTLFGGCRLIDDSSTDVYISCGSSKGSPYTWVWLCGSDESYWLGYKLTSDTEISLRLYRRVNNDEQLIKAKACLCDAIAAALKQLLSTERYDCLQCEITRGRAKCNESELLRISLAENDISTLKKCLYQLVCELTEKCGI